MKAEMLTETIEEEIASKLHEWSRVKEREWIIEKAPHFMFRVKAKMIYVSDLAFFVRNNKLFTTTITSSFEKFTVELLIDPANDNKH